MSTPTKSRRKYLKPLDLSLEVVMAIGLMARTECPDTPEMREMQAELDQVADQISLYMEDPTTPIEKLPIVAVELMRTFLDQTTVYFEKIGDLKTAAFFRKATP